MAESDKSKEKDIDKELIFEYLTSKVIRFRGILQDYERWKGYECEVLGPSFRLPYSAHFINDDSIKIYNEGIEALVNYQDYVSGHGFAHDVEPVGLPIRKKR